MKKRKILGWGAGVAAGLGLLAVMMLSFSMNRTGRQYRAFEIQMGRVEERAARLAAQLNEKLQTGDGPPTSTTRELTSARLLAGEPATTMTLFARELGKIQQDWMDLEREAERRDFHIYLPFLLEQGIGGGTIVLDAGEFPDEGAKGALRGGAALRGRIRQEAGTILKTDARRSTRLAVTANALSSGTLANRMDQLTARVGRLLLNDAAAPDPVRDAPIYTYNYELLGSAAALRAGLRGQGEEAGRMLERLVCTQLQSRLRRFPFQGDFWIPQKTILLLAEEGKLGDAPLARIEAMLRRARIDDKQLADLRAAYVLRTNREMAEAGARTYAEGVRDGRNRAMLFFESQAERSAMALLLAAIRPLMMSWVNGDEAAYDRAARHPVNVTFMSAFRYPSELAAFSRDPAANDAIDQTRLIVAAARWHLARGRWPERIEDLIPQYLESGFANGAESFYAVDRLETPARDDQGETGGEPTLRPIFYHARRLPLTLMRLQGINMGSGPFRFTNTVRIQDMTNPFWARLGLRGQVGMAQMMTSDRRAEGIVVRAVWPSPEPLATGWVRNMKTEGAKP